MCVPAPLTGGSVWSGLTIMRPGSTACSNTGCDGLLQWPDGSAFIHKPWHGPISIATGDYCITFDTGTGQFVSVASFCYTQELPFACQSKCEVLGCRVEPELANGAGQRIVPGGDNMTYVIYTYRL